ncbi:hypothetical protein [Nocardia terpenica]|uniref:Uncharacterized protein n=1 Tax=Nocardia terpenica TaxID=455432 RepID=A0A6G9Z9Q9_9NOCA|nr:hypothetical protein [Nocardia terpenica]QIS22349.1 hypothetical protein F6W96_32435 [Nocardia terpenica]
MSGIALLVLILAGLVICVLVLRSVRMGSVQIDVIPEGTPSRRRSIRTLALPNPTSKHDSRDTLCG